MNKKMEEGLRLLHLLQLLEPIFCKEKDEEAVERREKEEV